MVDKPWPHRNFLQDWRHIKGKCMDFILSPMVCMFLQTSSEEIKGNRPTTSRVSAWTSQMSFVVEAALTITWSVGEKKTFLMEKKLAACCLTPLSIVFKMSSSYAPTYLYFHLRQAQRTSDQVHLFLIESWNLKCLKGPEKLSYPIT